MLLSLAALTLSAQLGFADGPPVEANDLRVVASSRFRVKEVARFWFDRPVEVKGVEVCLAGHPGTTKVHIWKDIDHEWPFYRFERDLAPPTTLRLSKAAIGQWQPLRLGRRRLIVENPGYLYVGLEVAKNSPQLAVDGKLDRLNDSRYEVVDLANTRSPVSYWPRAKGDYAVRIRTISLPEPKSLFRDVTAGVGLENAKGAAIAWADVDGDGWEDLLVGGTRLYENEKGKRFLDITHKANLGSASSFGVFADVDSDGDQDLFLGASGDNSSDRLLLNDGHGRFRRAAANIEDGWPTKSATWLDYDLDGRIDLFVGNGADGIRTRNRLWRNLGGGRFKLAPISAINGSRASVGFFRSAVAVDLDLDGRSEVAVSTLRQQPDQLWWITKSSARDRAHAMGFDVFRSPGGKRTGGQGAGVAAGDLDGDARPDLWVANLMHPDWRGYEASVLSSLFLSHGKRTLRRFDADRMGLEFDESPADPTLGDFDNDGDLDAYVGSSYHHGDFYENVGGKFRNGTYRSGIAAYRGEASAACDFDHDGRLDLAVQTQNRSIRLYRNVAPVRSWLKVKLPPTKSIGASVVMSAGDRRFLRQAIAGKGLGSQDSGTLHFGLGEMKKVDAVRILWPGGRTSNWKVNRINRRIDIPSNG